MQSSHLISCTMWLKSDLRSPFFSTVANPRSPCVATKKPNKNQTKQNKKTKQTKTKQNQ